MKKDRIDDAIALFETAYYTVPSMDSESGDTTYDVQSAPRFHNVRRIKRRHADYRPGPVKVFTEQEIEDYVKSKSIYRDD